MKTNAISHNSPNQPISTKNHQQQLKRHHKSRIMNTQVMNHQQQYFITTTTSIKHEFLHKSTTT